MSEDPKPNLWLVLTPAMTLDLRTGTLMLRIDETGEIKHISREEYLADCPTPETLALGKRMSASADEQLARREKERQEYEAFFEGDQWEAPPEPIEKLRDS